MTCGNVIIPVRCTSSARPAAIHREIDQFVVEAALVEQRLGLTAIRAWLGGVDGDLVHYFRKYSLLAVAGPLKTDAIVLRSIRYGEADRILHLYTPARGRVGAIAKGVRRTRSRFGGRLEPFSRVRLICHEGRGELLTVTAAETLDGTRGPARQRRDAGRRGARLRRGRADLRDRGAASRRLQPARERAGIAGRRRRGRHAWRTRSPSASSCWSRRGSRRHSPRARRAAASSTSSATRPRPAASSAAPARQPRSRSRRRPTCS